MLPVLQIICAFITVVCVCYAWRVAIGVDTTRSIPVVCMVAASIVLAAGAVVGGVYGSFACGGLDGESPSELLGDAQAPAAWDFICADNVMGYNFFWHVWFAVGFTILMFLWFTLKIKLNAKYRRGGA